MPIVQRIKELALPAGQYVVIGSGILDALGLREADDIDLVVTPEYFARLKITEGWTLAVKHDDEVLTNGDQEVWLNWGSTDGLSNFAELYENGVTIDGIRFANPEFVRNWKVLKDRPKDRHDVELLDAYLRTRA